MNTTDLRKDHFFEISCHTFTKDYRNMVVAINQGIDTRLTAFVKSEWSNPNPIGKVFFWIHKDEIEILVRRLLELDDENAEQLADDIIRLQYGVEIL